MPTYYVSRIWTDSNGIITHVNAHETNNTAVSKAKKLSVTQVISGMRLHEFYTAKWGYGERKWFIGARIHAVDENGQTYLRSNHDNKVSGNLDNMLLMENFGC